MRLPLLRLVTSLLSSVSQRSSTLLVVLKALCLAGAMTLGSPLMAGPLPTGAAAGFFTAAPVNFGSVPIGTITAATSVTFNATASGTITVQVLTLGQPNPDFQGAGTNCSNPVTANTSCTLLVTFRPTAPGPRYGAMEAFDSNGNVIATAYLSGTGVGPLAGLTPGKITTVAGNGTSGFSGDSGLATSAGLNIAAGVALDAAGNIYIADELNQRIRKVTPGIGGIITTVAGNGTAGISGDGAAATVATLNLPSGVALDAASNIYIADTSNNRIRTVAVGASSLSFATSEVGSQSSDSPRSVTLTNNGTSALTFPIPTAGNNPSVGSGFTLDSATTCPTLTVSSPSAGTLGSGTSCTFAVDSIPSLVGANSSALTLTDNNLNLAGSQQRVTVSGAGTLVVQLAQAINFVPIPSPVTFGVGAITLSATGGGSGNPVTFSAHSGPGIVSGNSLTITGAGSVVVAADQAGSTSYLPAAEVTQTVVVTQAVKTITLAPPATPAAVNSTATLAASASNDDPVIFSVLSGVATISGATITYTNAGTVTIAADSPATANYAAALEVSYSVEVSPAASAYAAPTTAVSQTSAPQTATVNITAAGTLGSINVVTQGATGLDFNAVADGTCAIGTSYTAGQACTVEYSFTPIAPGLRKGAVQLTDSLGNVLATTLIHGIGEGPAVAFDPGVQTVVPTSGLLIPLSIPLGVTVDAAGDLFITDGGNGRVVKVTPSGVQTTVYSGPQSVGFSTAVDGAGDVFITDYNNRQVVEVTPSGVQTIAAVTSFPPVGVAVDGVGNLFISGLDQVVKVPAGGGAQSTVVSGLSNARVLAVDGAGNIFVPDYATSQVLKVTPSGVQTTVGTGLNGPLAVAVDGAGNVFVVDSTKNQVVEVKRSQPPALTFASTNVGSTSTDSPQSVTIQNIGNQPLTAVAPGLSIGTNFVQATGSGTPPDCTSGVSLAAGASCNLSVSFLPTASGAVSSTATFTDNALNASPSATQSVTLTGMATGGAATATISISNLPASGVYGGSFTPTYAYTGDNGVESVTSSSAACTVTGGTVSFVAVGTCTLTAHVTAGTDYAAADGDPQSFQVTTATATVTVTSCSVPYDGSAHTATVTATGVGGADLSTDVTLSTTHTAAGTYTLDGWTFTDPAGNYTASSGSVTDTITKLNAKVSPDALSKTYGTADPTLTGTPLGFLPVDGVTASYTRIAGEAVLGGPYTISATLSPAAALANYTITYNTALFITTKANATVAVTPYSVVYNAASHTATGTATGIGGVILTGLALNTTHTNAGSYTTDSWIFTDATGNYNNATATITDTITKAPATISISDIPATATAGGSFAVTFAYTGDGVASVTSSTATCTVAGTVVTFVSAGTCTLTAQATTGTNYAAATGSAQSFTIGANTTKTATLTPSAPNFGSVQAGMGAGALCVGGAPCQTFTLTNAGSVAMTGIGQGVVSGDASFVIVRALSTCGPGGNGQVLGQTTLNAGAKCYVSVQFRPLVSGGVKTGSVSVTDSFGTQSSTLTGTATVLAVPSFTWTNGGTVGAWATATGARTITITNTGATGSTLVMTALPAVGNLTGGNQFARTGGTCTATTSLSLNQACTVIVTRTRPATNPVATGTLTLHDTGGAAATQTLNLSGN